MAGVELALAFPYSLGLIAAFNPCGFALLPAYLSYFLGIDGAGASTRAGEQRTGPQAQRQMLSNLLRAIAVSLTLTAGFIVVFGAFGVLFETVLSQSVVLDRIGWVTIVVGVAMAALGLWMLAGKAVNLRLPKMSRGTDGRGLGSVFAFGVSYAVVSLSCTIGLFVASVTATFTDVGFLDGVANFVAYGVGMGSVITFLTLALAMARTGVVARMRGALRWVNRVSGVLLVLAGVYLVNYGWWELQLIDDPTAENALVNWFINLQIDLQNWIADTTPHRLGVLCVLGVIGALLMGWRQVEPNAIKRRSVIAAYLVVWLVVEFGFNRGDFVVGPILRFVAAWPARVANWFTDPLRVGVAGEIAFTALVLWVAVRATRKIWRRTRQEELATARAG